MPPSPFPLDMLFTTSWDDGYALDRKIADLLGKHGLSGTFYVCPKPQHGQAMLNENEIKALAKEFEIGAHTLTHPKLTEIGTDAARKEIQGGKIWIEEVTGKSCDMFCYPKGDDDANVRKLVQEAGYLGARTCETLEFEATDPFRLPVSAQIAPFPWRKRFKPAWKYLDPLGPLRVQRSRLIRLGIPVARWKSWLSLSVALFEHAMKEEKPFFHLYGHSREVELFKMWDNLDRFFSFVAAQRTAIECVTNSELVTRLHLHS